MEIYSFKKSVGKRINQFHSDFIMSRVINTLKPAHIGCMYLEENGVIGFHQAVIPQLLIIVNGRGSVRANNEEYIEVQAGEAVFWTKGEWHETKSETGLTAIVIESEELTPGSFMALTPR
ncbi:cupin [Metabacillus litoralis]|uniref:cupin n=1 Tax=Metabacillus litoralis TaxID=152268 RepID=UPI001BA125A2|nr:cupin [Metabacillus litoralis]MCM3163535.1 cupin [Metabacillus litoralis]